MRSITIFLALVPLLLAAAADYEETWVTPPSQPQPLLTHRTFHSESMGRPVGYNIYLPPQYDSDPRQRFPVIYWLHGLNGSESWDSYPPALVDRAIREKPLMPVVIVYASGGRRTFYSDSPDGTHMAETALIRELIPHIDARYRTIASRKGRAIQGMSMGGFGALKLAFKYPELFSSVVAFAPSLRTPESIAAAYPDIFQRMFHSDPAVYLSNHPLELLRKSADRIRAKLHIAVFIGDKDHLLDDRLPRLLEELRIEHVYESIPGIDHNLTRLVAHVGPRSLEFAQAHFVQPDRGRSPPQSREPRQR